MSYFSRSQVFNFKILMVLLFAIGMIWSSSDAYAGNPSGTYQQTCQNVATQGSALTGQCKTINGSYADTKLADYQRCIGDIQNVNGQLHCNMGAKPPAGSYTQTCQDAYMSGSTLTALCQVCGGAWASSPSSLDTKTCAGGLNIVNASGKLLCAPVPPAGSYQQSCCPFYMAHDGVTLYARCQQPGGNYAPLTQIDDVGSCRGDIYNFQGVLTCATGTADAPAGSYKQSCWDITVKGTTLSAYCNTADVPGPTTLVNINKCHGDISNQNGRLTCSH